MDYINIGNLKEEKLGKFKEKIITKKVILTYERLYNHILIYHKEEYIQLKDYINEIVEYPDFILEDNIHKDTLIFLKHINDIDKKARIVIKLATDKVEKVYNKNSIITIMRQRNKSWEQTLKNRGKIIFSEKLDKNE